MKKRPKTSKKAPGRLILFNKPFNILCQFTDRSGRKTLADYISVPNVYAAGRLDYDSEGLVILTDIGSLQARITEPRFKLKKTYLVQVEGIPADEAMNKLRTGVILNDGLTLPADAEVIGEPQNIWPRVPPIRFRKTIPDTWIRLTIMEGRNRQVRRMTAAVGLPTLRLIRVSVGQWSINLLKPGEWTDGPLPEGFA